MKLSSIGLALALIAGSLTGASAQTMSYAEAGAALAQSCGKDIEKLCPKANLGGGQLLGCLQEQKAKVNPQCVAEFQSIMLSLDKRAAAQAAVPKLCRNDVTRHCQGMVPGDAHFLDCLLVAKRVVTAACNQAIDDAGWR